MFRQSIAELLDAADGLSLAGVAADGLSLAGVAADGASALARLEEHRPAVALLHLGLPILDGLAVLAAARERSFRS
jgi:CheY-like chemotaxis protein